MSRAPLAVALTALAVALGAAPAAAKTLLLPFEGEAAKVEEAVRKQLTDAGIKVTLAETSFADAAAVVGCNPATDRCANRVAKTLRASELVFASSARNGDLVFERAQTGKKRRRVAVPNGTADLAAAVERAVVALFDLPPPIPVPAPALPGPPDSAAGQDETVAPVGPAVPGNAGEVPPLAATSTAPAPATPNVEAEGGLTAVASGPAPISPTELAKPSGMGAPVSPPPSPTSSSPLAPDRSSDRPSSGAPLATTASLRRSELRPQARAWVYGAFAASGVAIVGGALFWRRAANLQDEIDRAPTTSAGDLRRLVDLEDRAAVSGTAGNVLMVGGVALAGAGLYFLVANQRASTLQASSAGAAPRVAPLVGDRTLGVVLTFGGSP